MIDVSSSSYHRMLINRSLFVSLFVPAAQRDACFSFEYLGDQSCTIIGAISDHAACMLTSDALHCTTVSPVAVFIAL